MNIPHRLFSAVALAATIVSLLAQPATTAPAKTYRNPIIDRIGPADPHVIRHDGKYYMYPTLDGKGYDVFVSDDLVRWEQKGKCFTDARGGAWAPDVFHNKRDDGKFYLYYTVNRPGGGKQIGVAVADGPMGPFHNCTNLVNRSIDAHLFQDDDGALYLYYVEIEGGFKIKVQPMADPLTKKGEPTEVIRPTADWERKKGAVTEGPWMLKHKGLYYLMYSGSGADGPDYAVGYATAKSPLGPFTKHAGNPIAKRGNGVFGPGHHSVITGPDGKLWMMYHQQNSEKIGWERFLAIDPLWFDEHGVIHAKTTRGTDEPSPSTARSVSSLGSGDLDESIRRVRMGTLIIDAPPGAEVRVEQIRHEFWFGAALANHIFGRRADVQNAAKYQEVFLQNFNAAVTENALKWHVMEVEKGKIDYSTVDAILDWTHQHEIPLRGHNVFWGIPNRVQPWQKQMDNETLRAALKDRAVVVARRYCGRFAEYDLNNEMLHGNYYEERLGPTITKEMAMWMRAEDPQCVLYLNDYDILTGRRLEDYIGQIRKFLEQGVPIGGIGVQGHLHGDSFDPVVLKNALDRLGEFKLPIRITEFNFPGQRSKYYGKRDAQLSPEEEQAKAKALTDYYRICFAHPAVEGIVMWGFWEGANWIPVSSLYRRDWTPTPAADAYRDLVFKEWWTKAEQKTDAQGHCEVRAFFGKHRITAGSKETIVELKRSDGVKRITLR